MHDEVSEFLTPRELASWLRVSEDAVRHWCQRRFIPVQRVGRRVVFDRGAILRWLEAQQRPASGRR